MSFDKDADAVSVCSENSWIMESAQPTSDEVWQIVGQTAQDTGSSSQEQEQEHEEEAVTDGSESTSIDVQTCDMTLLDSIYGAGTKEHEVKEQEVLARTASSTFELPTPAASPLESASQPLLKEDATQNVKREDEQTGADELGLPHSQSSSSTAPAQLEASASPGPQAMASQDAAVEAAMAPIASRPEKLDVQVEKQDAANLDLKSVDKENLIIKADEHQSDDSAIELNANAMEADSSSSSSAFAAQKPDPKKRVVRELPAELKQQRRMKRKLRKQGLSLDSLDSKETQHEDKILEDEFEEEMPKDEKECSASLTMMALETQLMTLIAASQCMVGAAMGAMDFKPPTVPIRVQPLPRKVLKQCQLAQTMGPQVRSKIEANSNGKAPGTMKSKTSRVGNQRARQ